MSVRLVNRGPDYNNIPLRPSGSNSDGMKLHPRLPWPTTMIMTALRYLVYQPLVYWTNLYASMSIFTARVSWRRHQIETFSALLAICAGNSPVPGEFPTQRPVTRSFDVSFDLRLNKRLCKQSWGWWFEMLLRTLWRHRNTVAICCYCMQVCICKIELLHIWKLFKERKCPMPSPHWISNAVKYHYVKNLCAFL